MSWKKYIRGKRHQGNSVPNDKSQRSAQEIFFLWLIQKRLAKRFKASRVSFYLFTRTWFSMESFYSCTHSSSVVGHSKKKKNKWPALSRDNTSNLRWNSIFYFILRLLHALKLGFSPGLYANICVITLPQINWNEQSVSAGLSSPTCSFD